MNDNIIQDHHEFTENVTDKPNKCMQLYKDTVYVIIKNAILIMFTTEGNNWKGQSVCFMYTSNLEFHYLVKDI